MRFTPKGYGGQRRDPEQVKQEGWQELGVLAVSIDDHRLTWPERELVEQLGYEAVRATPCRGGASWLITSGLLTMSLITSKKRSAPCASYRR
jgi:hypothetical protein